MVLSEDQSRAILWLPAEFHQDVSSITEAVTMDGYVEATHVC